MKKVLIVIDMQNDFITGSLGSVAAQRIVPYVQQKVKKYRGSKSNDVGIIFTQDTHNKDYLCTPEGRNLPVEHCLENSDGWLICDGISVGDARCIPKAHFGYDWSKEEMLDGVREIELVGLCTDICVIANALTIKTLFPEAMITVDSKGCAGSDEAAHDAALLIMKKCHINVV